MNKEMMFNRLVENALDFLYNARSQIKEYPKYSVIHFHTAVELFVKARLMAEHWSLVIAKRQEPDWDKFISGDFQSVSLDEAADRLSKVVRSGLSKQMIKAFRDVAKHRNKMVHFFHEAHTDEDNNKVKQDIVKQQLTAWYFLHRLLTAQWEEVFESWSEKIVKIDHDLRQMQEFLHVVFENISPEIEKLKSQGIQFKNCPSCGFASQEHRDEIGSIYEAKCLVCGLTERYLQIVCPECSSIVIFKNEGFATCDSCGKRFEPEDVADILIDDVAAHIAAKDGDDSWDLGNCSICDGYHTVVRMKNDDYICASCFEVFESLQWCEWCNEPNTGDMEHSYWAGCSHCGGKAEWDKDD